MAAYIPVPRDLTRVKSKVFFNLTKRQLICFGAAALIGVPFFFFLKSFGNVSLAAFLMLPSKQIIGSSTFTALAESLKLPERRTMGAKLERLGAELAKARKKKAEWDSRVKDLERRYREEENSEIHEMVHAANLTPDQLSELLKMFAEDSAPKPETIQSVTEEETTHEN